MLTREQIKKVSRLEQQVGELRPGYLRDGTAALEGPFHGRRRKSSSSPRKRQKAVKGKVKFKISFHQDPETGEIQILQH